MNAPAEMWPNLSALIGNAITIMLDPRPPTRYTRAMLREWSRCPGIPPELAEYLRTAAPSNRPDISTRNGNICLHYLIATEGMWHKHRHKEEREHALTRIAGLWDREPSYVPDILTEHREAAQTWLDNLLEYNSDFAKPEEILKALDADLMLHAASWPRHREGQ
jgi:hypothetical protein